MACMRLEELRQELSNERHGGNVEIKRLDDVPENSVWNMEYLANLKVVLLSDTSTFFLENYFFTYRRLAVSKLIDTRSKLSKFPRRPS